MSMTFDLPTGAILIVVLWLAVIAEFDRRHARIPNLLVIPGVVALAVGGYAHPMALLSAGAAGVGYLAGFVTGGCGAGDVKLAVVLGGLLADPVSAATMVLAAQLITLAGFAVHPSGGRRRPHGPALASAFLVTAAVSAAVCAWNN